MAEAYFSAKLIQSLIASGIEGSMIGVITLYKSQMNKVWATYLKKSFNKLFLSFFLKIRFLD